MPEASSHSRTLVLRPTSTLSWQDVREIWDYRDLLWTLALRDVKVRYKQTSLGIAWAVLQPLVQVVVFTVLFNRVAGLHSDTGVSYALFTLGGVTVWGLFANGLSHASESLITNSALVTKVYFPRLLIPLASILTAIVDTAIAALLLLGLMVAQRVPFHASAVLAVPIVGIAGLWAASLGLWTSALNLQYRDVRYALPFFIQILVFLTPVYYSSSVVPDRYRSLLSLNPMVPVVDGFRAAVFGGTIPFTALGITLVLAILVGLAGFIRFRQLERTFADRI